MPRPVYRWLAAAIGMSCHLGFLGICSSYLPIEGFPISSDLNRCYRLSCRQWVKPIEGETMRWEYEELVEEFIRGFCEDELPSAQGLDELDYRISSVESVAQGSPRFYRVEVDVPTEASDAWVAFVIDEMGVGEEPVVRDLSCVWDRVEGHEGETCVWHQSVGEWKLFEGEC